MSLKQTIRPGHLLLLLKAYEQKLDPDSEGDSSVYVPPEDTNDAADLVGADLFQVAPGYRLYRLTPKGEFYVEHLLTVPLPVEGVAFTIPKAV